MCWRLPPLIQPSEMSEAVSIQLKPIGVGMARALPVGAQRHFSGPMRNNLWWRRACSQMAAKNSGCHGRAARTPDSH